MSGTDPADDDTPAEGRRAADPFTDASPLRATALALRFLLELALLAAVAVSAWHVAPTGWEWPAALLALVAVAAVWGLLLSPKARYDIRPAGRLALELLLFAGAAAGLIAVGQHIAAASLCLVWAVDRIVLAIAR